MPMRGLGARELEVRELGGKGSIPSVVDPFPATSLEMAGNFF